MVQLYRLTHTRAGWMHLDGICAASAHENPLRTHGEVESVHGRRKEMQEGEGTFFYDLAASAPRNAHGAEGQRFQAELRPSSAPAFPATMC